MIINNTFLSEPILIVEDDFSSSELLKVYLQKYTTNIYKAENASDAIEILKNNLIKIVFSDLKLPDINGYELMKKIKENYPGIIIVGQSGFAMEDDVQEAINEGFDFYITKPITSKNIADLMEAINKKLK